MKLQAITNVDHRIEYPQIDEVDPRLVSVIKSCLERDISQRPSVSQLLDHSYLTAAAAAVTPAPAANLNSVKMMAAFEGFMSPNTLKKTKEILRQAGQLE